VSIPMSVRRFLLPPLIGAAVLAPAAPAYAAQSHLLWATVNVCDTPQHPNMVGVRASMPGNGTRQRMYMRFSAWWYSRDKRLWSPVGGARSRWTHVGSARFRSNQGGYTFTISPPPASQSFVVRGVVEMEWRERRRRKGGKAAWVAAKRLRATTREGVANVAEGDPPGLSLGVCEVR
jgi:hypothetical protein